MMDRRTLLGTVAGITATLGLAACGRRNVRAPQGAEAVPDSWLRLRIAEPVAIDPLLVADRAGLQVLSALFMPLMKIDAAGNLVTGAASSYEMSEDARTFTFHLPSGALFAGGESVTASSFKLGWERLVRAIDVAEGGEDREEAEYGAWGHLLRLIEGYDALRSGRASELVGLRCPDDLTYVVSLTEPCPYFAQVAAHPALAPIPTGAYRDAEAFAAKPDGNGPFKLEKTWKRGEELRLSVNEGCVAAAPSVDGALLVPMGDTVAAYKQFRAGNIDICDVPVDQLADAEQVTRVSESGATLGLDGRLAHGLEGGLVYLACNCMSGAFSRPDIRLAASLSIDREGLCRKVLKYSVETASGPVSPRIGDTSAWEACAYDPERAAQLVEMAVLSAQEAAVARDGSVVDGTQVPTVESEPLSLDVSLIYRKGGTGARTASYIVRDLEAAGLSVKSEGLDAAEFNQRYRSGDFDCALRTLEPCVPTLDVVADALFAQAGRVPGVHAAYDAAIAETLSRAWSAPGPSEREALVREALAQAGESLPIIPLGHPAYTKVASERVLASTVDASGRIDLVASDLR